MAIDLEKAFDVSKYGLAIRDDDGEVLCYISSGQGSPVGINAPIPTVFVSDSADVWVKFGASSSDWRIISSTNGDLYIGGVSANYVFLPEQCVGGGDANGN